MRIVPYVLPRLNDAGGDYSKEWFVYFFYEDQNGKLKRFRKTDGFSLCTTAEEKRAHGNMLCLKYELELINGWNPFIGRRTVEKINHLEYSVKKKVDRHICIEHYLNCFIGEKKKQLRDKSVSTYLTKLRVFNEWLIKNNLSDIPLVSFQISHSRNFFDNLQSNKLSNKTINSYIETLECAWNWIKEFYDIELNNPWKKVERLQVSISRKLIFNHEQRVLILNHLKKNDIFLWMVCMLIFKSFIRPGREIRGLQVKDIDLNENLIWIPSEISKNKKTQSVPLPSEVKIKLMELDVESHSEKSYLFSRNGISNQIASRDFWSKRFTTLMRELKIPKGLTIYNWKHTGNNIAHKSGMPLKMQKELNRHHSLDQMDTYLSSMTAPDPSEIDKFIQP